jgi:hypothetical protein
VLYDLGRAGIGTGGSQPRVHWEWLQVAAVVGAEWRLEPRVPGESLLMLGI